MAFIKHTGVLKTNDSRLRKLVEDFGFSGYGFFWLTVEFLLRYEGRVPFHDVIMKRKERGLRKDEIIKIVTEYGLFETDENGMLILAPDCPPECMPARPRGRMVASTSAGHSRSLKELELELPLNEEEVKFRSLMVENYPNVMAMRKPLKKYEYDRGVARFGEDTVTTVIQAMENTPKLTTKYISANLTMVDWCKRRSN